MMFFSTVFFHFLHFEQAQKPSVEIWMHNIIHMSTEMVTWCRKVNKTAQVLHAWSFYSVMDQF